MSGNGSSAWILSFQTTQTTQAIKAGRASVLPVPAAEDSTPRRGPYHKGKGDMAQVRMPDGRIEEIPWAWLDGDIPPIRVSRRKATFCDARGILEAMEALERRSLNLDSARAKALEVLKKARNAA